MLSYQVKAKWVDHHHSEASCKQAKLTIDSDLRGNSEAFNPAELLLASLAACILKNIERVAPILNFKFEAIEIEITGERQDSPPKMQKIDYTVRIKTEEIDKRLALLHTNIEKYGTIYNTLKTSTELSGRIEKLQ
ncbi:OsmC family protein [Thiomicrorhabdus sp. Milos-T2]|uniref:OsmC family protein n=1 Tax=Thiomicrorhabdus sp. Milos-T2 TaxID=90814 RepID=UPI0004941ED4|nr:OsmC family protein [Thiomicrorhabdus sp. Milos-T2]